MNRNQTNLYHLIAELLWEAGGRQSEVAIIENIIVKIKHSSPQPLNIRVLHGYLFKPLSTAGQFRVRVSVDWQQRVRDYPNPAVLESLRELFNDIYWSCLQEYPSMHESERYQACFLTAAMVRGVRFFEYGNRLVSLLVQSHLLHHNRLPMSHARLLSREEFLKFRSNSLQPIWERMTPGA
jgi:hypothetical protein